MADPDPPGVLILTAVNAVMLLATVVVAGIWSDRTGRRKPFVLWSGVLIAAATGLLACWQTWAGAVLVHRIRGVA